MDFIKTKVFCESWDVDRRLNELGLTRTGLLTSVAVAIQECANATPFHCANAAGTFSYQFGTWALRDQFVGDAWVVDRVDGVESIRNDALRIKVGFSNVDVACNDHQLPKPRSDKGSGVERATNSDLFGDLPHYAPRPSGEISFYYLMVDEIGAAELTRAVVKDGIFVAAIERIYLSDSNEGGVTLLDDGDVADDFDPQIARK